MGLFFIQTWQPVTISVLHDGGLCLRDLARYFSQTFLRCANGNTPLIQHKKYHIFIIFKYKNHHYSKLTKTYHQYKAPLSNFATVYKGHVYKDTI